MEKDIKETSLRIAGNKWVAAGFIALVTAAVYWNSLNAPFIFDDVRKIVDNPDITRLGNLGTKLIYPYGENANFERNDPSRPLVYLTFTLNYYFGKYNTFGYHLFNLIMHILNAVLVFFLAGKILGYILDERSAVLPFFAALLFAVHPVNTSVVSYVFSRSDILAVFFYVLSLLFFIRAFERERKIYLYALSYLCFGLSLFSKQTAATLPAIVLLLDYALLSGSDAKNIGPRKYHHAIFWAILAGYVSFRCIYFGGIGDIEAKTPWNRIDYLVLQPYAVLRYLKMLVFPAGLCIDHNLARAGILELRVLVSFVLMAGIFAAVYAVSRKRAGISKLAVFCCLWFFITLAPTSSFFPTTSALVENRVYLPGFGFYLLFVVAVCRLFGKGGSGTPAPGRIFWALMAACLLPLGLVTMERNRLYGDPFLMWQDVVSKYPGNSRAHNNLGVQYAQRGEYDKAAEEYVTAIKYEPGDRNAHNNLGVIYRDRKEYGKAAEEFRKLLEIDPGYAKAYYNLGLLYCYQGKDREAIRTFEKALEIFPGYADVHNNLGVVYYGLKDYRKAAAEYEAALRINPDLAEARKNLGVVEKIRSGAAGGTSRDPGAAAHYEKAVLYHNNKDYPMAIGEYKKALELKPGYAEARIDLGVLYFELKRYPEAAEEFEKVISANPSNIDARSNLGAAYYYQKEYRKALREYEYLLKLNPGDKKTEAIIAQVKKSLDGQP